jgi:hypothetical protein
MLRILHIPYDHHSAAHHGHATQQLLHSSYSLAMRFTWNAPQPAPAPPRRACVPLSHKRVPTEMRAPSDHEQLICAALLADDVDISALRDHMLSLPEAHWHEAYQQQHNVHFQRPFHDKLGVNSIMCLFSDTPLETVLELPFYAVYRPYLEPLFARIGIAPSQVVRCLFARLPGATLIPPHHDNGVWVSKTHRVHVPIETFADVEFHSGPLESSMKRYAFNERTIVELNNAAKHSVWNPGTRYRIHLIFDYVEDTALLAKLTRHVLTPGQVCRQVRGRVELFASDATSDSTDKKQAAKLHAQVDKLLRDRVGSDAAAQVVTACRHYFIEQISAKDFVKTVERVLRGHADEQALSEQLWPTLVQMFALVDTYAKRELLAALRRDVFAPHWVIIGAQKCGTTSLYELLSQHPQLLRGKRREPHFFDWSWHAALQFTLPAKDDALYKKILKSYAAARRSSRHPEDVATEDEEENAIEKRNDLEGNSLDDMRYVTARRIQRHSRY